MSSMVNRRDNARYSRRDEREHDDYDYERGRGASRSARSSQHDDYSHYERDSYVSRRREGAARAQGGARSLRSGCTSADAQGDRTAARFARSTHDARSARSRAEAAAAQESGAYRRRSAGRGGVDAADDGENPYSRERMHQGDYSKARTKRKKRFVAIALSVVLVCVLVTAGMAWAYLQSISSQLNEGVDDDLLNALADTTYDGEPYYVLLMGSDGSLERENSAEHAGDPFRADSIILARIDPQQKTVSMVSLPRDTQVDMGEYGVNKLNAAHALGGAALAVETVSKMAGVEISHYAAVNFDGFAAAVDALGGVEVDVPMEIDDADAGGYLAAGPQTLNGEQALILCRARHAYDEIGPGDLYRAANQRLVLSAIAKKLLSSDPITIATTIQNLSQYVVTDMSVMDIVGTANSLRGIDTDSSIYSATAPTCSEYTTAWYEILIEDEWEEMMDRMDSGLPPSSEDIIDPVSGTILANAGNAVGAKEDYENTRTGSVSVKNGTNTAGLAAEAANRIATLGYDTTTGNANGSFDETVIVYDDDKQAEYAQEIADLLGQGKVVKNNNDYIYKGDFLVVIGSDWQPLEGDGS